MTPSPADGELYLSPEHRHMLEVESGINPMLHYERGCFTATMPAQLKALGYSDTQSQLVPALVFPSYGVDYNQPSTFSQIRPDNPRETKSGKIRKYEIPAGASIRLDIFPSSRLHEKLRDPNIPIYITEGFKKGDALWQRGLASIALAGVNNYRGKNEFGGIADLPCWSAIPLNGRTVYIVFDNDVMTKKEVIHAMRGLARMLKRKGASRVIPLVPQIAGHDGKLGVDDFFVRGGTVEQLLACENDDLLQINLPEITVTGRRGYELYEDALDALLRANDPPSIFVRSGELARVLDDGMSPARIEDLGMGGLKGHLTRCAHWNKLISQKGELVKAALPHPPNETVDQFFNERIWPGIPQLVGTSRHPVLSPNGGVTRNPGYCPDSLYFLTHKEKIPAFNGTVQDAVDYIFNDVICDFPFVDDADRAHALALMLLPIVRPAIDGPTPLHLFDAPAPGTGKSLLARACLRVTQQHAIAPTKLPEDDDSADKLLLSKFMAGAQYIFIDNLKRKLDSEAFEIALASTTYDGRVLGVSKTVSPEVRCAWVVTANNGDLTTDAADRTILIRLDAKMERPRERNGWKHPDIEGYIVKNRNKILSALCAIVEHWVDSGKPGTIAVGMGTFESWRNTIGGILECAGVPGFLGNVAELRDNRNPEHGAWADVCQQWWARFQDIPVRTKDVLEYFEGNEITSSDLGAGNEASRLARLGKWLRKRVGGIYGGYRIAVVGRNGYKLVENPNPATDAWSNVGFGGGDVRSESQPYTNSLNLERHENVGVCKVCKVSSNPPTCACIAHDALRAHDVGPECKVNPTNLTLGDDEEEIIL